MKLPELNAVKKITDDVSEFGGYNHNLVIGGHEFYDEENMSADLFPVLTQRKKRYQARMMSEGAKDYHNDVVLCSNDHMAYLLGGNLYYYNAEDDAYEIVAEDFGELKGKNMLISMGDKICSFPIGKVYDTRLKTVESINVRFPIDLAWLGDVVFKYRFNTTPLETAFDVSSNKTTGSMITKEIMIPYAEFIKQSGNMDFLQYVQKAGNRLKVDVTAYSFETSNYFKVTNVTYKALNIDQKLVFSVRLKAKKDLKKNKTYKLKVRTINIKANNLVDNASFVRIRMLDENGNEIVPVSSATEPTKKEGYWLDTSKTPRHIYRWIASMNRWDEVKSATYRFKYQNNTFPTEFKKDDVVQIKSQDLYGMYDQLFRIDEMATDGSYFDVHTIFEFAQLDITHEFIMSRNLPAFDYACECNNRIWGVSSATNEIYACKLGDPLNWDYVQDSAEDSYTLKFGSEGKFTGIYNYMGRILAFKENYIHILYGSKPQNYTLTTLNCDGIADGAWDSCGFIDGTLFYKGVHGVYAYSGNMPQKISDQFGIEKYVGGRGGIYDGKYYIYFTDVESSHEVTPVLFSFDTRKGIWHKESATDIGSNLEEHLSSLFYVTREAVRNEDERYELASYQGYTRVFQQDFDGREGDQIFIDTYGMWKVEFIDSIQGDYIPSITDYPYRITLDADCSGIRIYYSSNDPLVFEVEPGHYDAENDKYYVSYIEDINCWIYKDADGNEHKVEDLSEIQPGWTLYAAYQDYEDIGPGGGIEHIRNTILTEDLDPEVGYHIGDFDEIVVPDPDNPTDVPDTGKTTDVCLYNPQTGEIEILAPSDKVVSINTYVYWLNAEILPLHEYKYYLNSMDKFDGYDSVEDDFEWYAETGNIGFSLITRKWISKIVIRAEISPSATFKIEVSYDDPSYDNSIWEEIYSVQGSRDLNTLYIPIIAKRCDHLRYRFSGVGTTKIYSITKFVEQGSDI